MASAQVAIPHNFHAIAKDADSKIDIFSPQNVFKQLQSGVSLNQNTQKAIFKQSSDAVDFHIYASALTYNGGVWERYQDDGVEVAELISGNGIEVSTNFETSKLSQGKTYEVAFRIKMTENAEGWDNPVTLKFELPTKTTTQTTANLSVKPANSLIRLKIGEFPTTSTGMSGVMKISLSSPEVQDKSGLIIREIVLISK